jgi:hypothetical protein
VRTAQVFVAVLGTADFGNTGFLGLTILPQRRDTIRQDMEDAEEQDDGSSFCAVWINSAPQAEN